MGIGCCINLVRVSHRVITIHTHCCTKWMTKIKDVPKMNYSSIRLVKRSNTSFAVGRFVHWINLHLLIMHWRSRLCSGKISLNKSSIIFCMMHQQHRYHLMFFLQSNPRSLLGIYEDTCKNTLPSPHQKGYYLWSFWSGVAFPKSISTIWMKFWSGWLPVIESVSSTLLGFISLCNISISVWR